MTRRIFSAIAMLLSCCTLWASDYGKYYTNLPVEIRKATTPTIPNTEVSIKDYGGVGDAKTDNTEAFRKAISALSKQGGGRLVVPFGVWMTGPIVFKDNIELHLDKNAIIMFSEDKSLFIDKDGKSKRCDAALKASKRKNIAITGEGIIDGNGDEWRPVKRSKVSDVEWKRFKDMGGAEKANGTLWYPWNMKSGYANIADTPEAQEKMRNDLLRFTDCENVLIEGVTFQNSPRFHVHPVNCRNVIIDGITVRCPWNAQNGDAIDLSDCHQALIVNSTIDAGDDGLCMKSGNAKATALVNGCEDILIEGNTVFHAHGGFVIGSESITGMKRIVVRNCRFSGTDTGLRFKSGIGRGGKTEDIYISNITMNDIADEAIIFQCDYENKQVGQEDAAVTKVEKVPEFTDIHIDSIVCHGAKTAIAARGLKKFNAIHDIEIKNSSIIYTSKGDDIDAATAKINFIHVNLIPLKP